HIHGVHYGIDSDGSWPFGTQSDDGRRSDEICPGQTWTYTYDVTDETVGAWPFHDHCRNIGTYINRGLFGGLVVLPDKEHELLPKFLLPEGFHEQVEKVLEERDGQDRRHHRAAPSPAHRGGHGCGQVAMSSTGPMPPPTPALPLRTPTPLRVP